MAELSDVIISGTMTIATVKLADTALKMLPGQKKTAFKGIPLKKLMY